MTLPELLLTATAGGVIGSFSATFALRAVAGRPWALGRSACDHCSRQLSFAQTAPILSFMRARGRCGACSGAIDPTHLAGEIAGAAFLPICLLAAPGVVGGLLFVLAAVLLAASIVDLKTLRLPDMLTGGAAALCAIIAAMDNLNRLGTGLITAVICIAVGLGLRHFGRSRFRDAGLGLGDVKLVAALAIWLGAATAWAVALAAGAALAGVAWQRQKRIAFGPFISAAALAVGLFQEACAWPAFS